MSIKWNHLEKGLINYKGLYKSKSFNFLLTELTQDNGALANNDVSSAYSMLQSLY